MITTADKRTDIYIAGAAAAHDSQWMDGPTLKAALAACVIGSTAAGCATEPAPLLRPGQEMTIKSEPSKFDNFSIKKGGQFTTIEVKKAKDEESWVTRLGIRVGQTYLRRSDQTPWKVLVARSDKYGTVVNLGNPSFSGAEKLRTESEFTSTFNPQPTEVKARDEEREYQVGQRVGVKYDIEQSAQIVSRKYDSSRGGIIYKVKLSQGGYGHPAGTVVEMKGEDFF